MEMADHLVCIYKKKTIFIEDYEWWKNLNNSSDGQPVQHRNVLAKHNKRPTVISRSVISCMKVKLRVWLDGKLNIVSSAQRMKAFGTLNLAAWFDSVAIGTEKH
jgi:hypothetical protein